MPQLGAARPPWGLPWLCESPREDTFATERTSELQLWGPSAARGVEGGKALTEEMLVWFAIMRPLTRCAEGR